MSALEEQYRQQIMSALAERTALNGGFVTRQELTSFRVTGDQQIRLIDESRGIRNPKELAATISIVSSPDGPYDNREIEGGMFHYDYQSQSDLGDNTKLRRAYELGLPIILLRKIATGVFVPVFPTYVVADDRPNRRFIIAVDESLRFLANPLAPTGAEKRYAECVVRARLHQPEFRGRVIRAYHARFAICSLKHADLLDAAHIISNSADGGDPVVPNGLSLCKIHHAAFDRNLLGISPDYSVHLDADLLNEIDGPMLLHGLQEMHGRTLALPHRRSDQPDRDRLSIRFDAFRHRTA